MTFGLRTMIVAVVLVACVAAIKQQDARAYTTHRSFLQVSRTRYGNEPTGRGNKYYESPRFLGTQNTRNLTQIAGQEARVRIKTQFLVDLFFSTYAPTYVPAPMSQLLTEGHQFRVDLLKRYNSSAQEGYFGAFNITGPSQVRVRVIPAYPARAWSGLKVSCAQSTDYWAEFWTMSGRNLAWGHKLAFSAYVTFTVPPFPYKLCVKDVSSKNSTKRGRAYDGGLDAGWRDFDSDGVLSGTVRTVQEPLFVYSTSASMFESDYAAIKITATRRTRKIDRWYFDSHDFAASNTGLNGDVVKLVPAGFPCTYEKSSASADYSLNHPSVLAALSATVVSKQYCGSNVVSPTDGSFITSRCAFEGSIQNGAFRTGSPSVNPYQSTVTDNTPVSTLVAYGKLPAAGSYDICLSPKAYRHNATYDPVQRSMLHADPVWFKVYANSGSCSSSNTLALPSGCAPRTTTLVVQALSAIGSERVTWTADDTTPLSWGAIQLTGSGLSSASALSSGESSTTKEYYATTGGDQFRLIFDADFRDTAITSDGELYVASAGVSNQPASTKVLVETSETSGFVSLAKISSNIGTQSSTGVNFRQLSGAAPSIGSMNAYSGCWATSSATGSHDTWATYSGDLGGNPRLGWAPWLADATSQSSVWAYMRIPKSGKWRLCYRKAGTQNWRVISRDSSASDVTTAGYLLFPSYNNMYSNFTYYLNDSRAESYGEFTVYDRRRTLTTLDSNYMGTGTPIVGSQMKLVGSGVSCHTGTAVVESSAPGTHECNVGKCPYTGAPTCSADCVGPASNSGTLRDHIVFFLKIPLRLSSDYYRVCFKNGGANWRQLRFNEYDSSKMSAADRFNSIDRNALTYTLSDRREFSWAKLTFRLSGKNEYDAYLNSKPDNVNNEGDVVRLVVNETAHGTLQQVGCNAAFGTGTGPWYWDYALGTSADLGIDCDKVNTPPSGSTGPCTSDLLQPTSGSKNGNYPYDLQDSTNDQRVITTGNGTVAFMYLPSRFYPTTSTRPAAYRVCYKQAGLNWVEAVSSTSPISYLAITKGNAVVMGGLGTVIAGSYFKITLTGSSTALISPALDLLKLVVSSSRCDRPAAGTKSTGNAYISFAGTANTPRAGGYIVDGTNSTTIAAASQPTTTTVGAAFLVAPTLTIGTIATTTYSVCFMSRSSSSDQTRNWVNLGTVSVATQGITYTVGSKPFARGNIDIRFLAKGVNFLNTDAAGDSAKIVAITDPCFGGTDAVPSGVTSYHLGVESESATTAVKTLGLTNLGPHDDAPTNLAIATTTLPAGAGTTFKVCYQRVGEPWFEVEQTPATADRVYDLGANGLLSVDSQVTQFTLESNVIAQSPGSGQTTYGTLPYTQHVIGGASSATPSANYFYVTGSTVGASDAWRLVPAVAGAKCADEPYLSGTVASVASSQANILLNFPLGGNYLFCYRLSAETTWLVPNVPSSGSPTYKNPIQIVPSLRSFVASAATNAITVYDFFRTTDNNQGSLLQTDKVYFVNASQVCGYHNSFSNVAIATAALPLNGSDAGDGWYMPKRTVGQTVSFLSALLSSSSYKACLQVTSQDSTNVSTVKPFVKTGWYQIRNAGDSATGGNTDYYVTGKATALSVTCPSVLNASIPLRSGVVFEVTVKTVDGAGNLIPYSVGSYAPLITAAVNRVEAYNYAGQCRAEEAPKYDWDYYNLRQFAVQGVARFAIAVYSACPTEGCSLTFASAGLTAPTTGCLFAVQTPAAARVAGLLTPSTCKLNSRCRILLAVFASDNLLADTISPQVTVTASGVTGFSLAMTTSAVKTSLNPTSTGALTNGFFDVYIEPTSPTTAFTADTTVGLSFSVAGLNYTTSVKVVKPILSKVHIIDLYAETGTLTGNDLFVRSRLIPTWEPNLADYWFGGLDNGVVNGVSQVTAKSGYYLVAQQFYTVLLRGVATVNGVDEYITDQALLDSATGQRIITIVDSDLTAAGNSLIKSCADESCTSRLTTVSFTAVKQKVTFRFRNSKGCRGTGCQLVFQFDGADLGGQTWLKTPVRSIATRTLTECWADDGVSGFTAPVSTGPATCPESTVEKGWLLKLSAVDQDNDVDEYFEGNFLPLLRGGNGLKGPDGLILTTVSMLAVNGSAQLIQAPASAGVAWVQLLTVSRPCLTGCRLHVLSDWGANIADVGALVARASTVKLQCTLLTPLAKCKSDSPGGSCDSVVGQLTYSSTTEDNNKDSLLYRDTPICVRVDAVSDTGLVTLYETNWILYWAQAVQPASTTFVLKDTTNQQTDRRRYKPLARSTTTFCFTVGGTITTKAQFRLRFAAQRFNSPNYWSTTGANGANGECSLGVFTVWEKKHLVSTRVTRVTGMDSVTALPSSSVSLATQRVGTADPTVTIEWGYYDHYGNSIAKADLQTTAAPNLYLVIGKCTIDGLKTDCVSTPGTLDSAAGTATLSLPGGDGSERGMLTVTVSAASSAKIADGPASYTLTLAKYCIGCTLSFTVKNTDGDYKVREIFAGADSTVTSSVVLNVLIQDDNTVTRSVLFARGTSPLAGAWKTRDETNTADPSGLEVLLVKDTCWTTSSCLPTDTALLLASCDKRSGNKAIGSSTAFATGIKMYVVTTEAGASATTNKEPQCASSNNCKAAANVLMQVDILNSYAIAVSIGTQLLSCTEGCNNQGTASPSQIVSAYGATAKDAISAFGGSFRTTSMVLTGLTASSYTTSVTGKPSMSGKFSAQATTNKTGVTVTGLETTGSSFAWRSPAAARRFVLLDVATTSDPCATTEPTYSCLSAAASCTATGYERFAGLSVIGFDYSATTIPVGSDFPLTVQVTDVNGYLVDTATGSVTFSIDSWTGCNNGGTLSGTTTVTLVSGRATAWLRFSAACENCVIKAVLTPAATQASLYAALNANPGALILYSKRVTVSGLVHATSVIVSTPAPADLNDELQVSTNVVLGFRPIGSYGGLAGADATASVTVALYNRIAARSSIVWVGNGGILRQAKDRALDNRHGTSKTFVGESTLAFMFTQTCNSCNVVFASWVNGVALTPFLVRNKVGTSFSVTTAYSGRILAGFRPRSTQAGSPIGVALWHVGSELAGESVFPIAVAGVAKVGQTAAGSVSLQVNDNTNGDGGVVSDEAWVTQKAEAHRISVPLTCNRCTLNFGSDTMLLNVRTVATHIRPILGETTAFRGTFSSGVSSAFTFNVRAVDDTGITDVWFGGFTNCLYSLPFVCPSTASSDVKVTLSADGVSAGGFFSGGDGFQTVATAALEGTMSDSAKKIIDGRGTVSVTFTSPVRHATPIFGSGLLTSAANPLRPFVAPIIDVSAGSTGLSIVTQATGLDALVAFQTKDINVGLVRAVDTTAARYVSTDANNEIIATFGSGCPARSSTQPTSIRLVKGYGKFPLTFSEPSKTASTCKVLLTVGSGAGTCTVCTTEITVVVGAITATKWKWLRPTALENGAATSGPMFGAQGRRTFLSIGLTGPAAGGVGDVDVQTCDDLSTNAVETCTFTVTADSTCTDKPRIDSPVTFTDSTKPPSLTVLWAEGSTGSAYTCALIATVTRGSTVLTGPTTAPTDKPSVTVCKPNKIAMVTNATSAYRGLFLQTGRAYPFYTVMLDSDNKHCRGDSQDDATELVIDAVTTDRVPRTSDAVQVVNVNVTESTTISLANALQASLNPSAAAAAPSDDSIPAKNTVKAIGGGFQFAVVFSNSTISQGIAGVRVRVTARSTTPDVSGTRAVVISSPVDTVVAASMLRFRPDTLLPRFIVAGREVIGGAKGDFVVQAVDGVSPSWVAQGLVRAAPNVARGAQDFGNDAAVSWTVSPPVDGPFPFTFARGARDSKLVGGEATFGGLNWGARDGDFHVAVAHTGAIGGVTLKPTAPQPINAQRPTKLVINTLNFRPEAGTNCDANCYLPNSTFGLSKDNVTQAPIMNTTNLRGFNISVFVSDANNRPVQGDNEGVIEVSLENPSTTTSVRLALPEAYLVRAPIQVRVMRGVANFFLGFTGTTLEPQGVNNHSRVRIVFSCPENRTAATVLPGEALKNPCFGLPQGQVKSLPIEVRDGRAPSSAYQDPIVRAAQVTLKLQSTLTDLALFNVTDFLMCVANQLTGRFPFLTPSNVARVLPMTVCEVTSSFGSNDLGSTVCGTQGRCTQRGASDCPVGVLRCSCPATTARALLLSRYLLQTSTTARINGEININLQAAEGYRGANANDIAATYTALGDALKTLLQTPQGICGVAVGLDTNSIGTQNPNNPPKTLPPITPVPPTPVPTPPLTPQPTEGNAASGVSATLTLLLAAVLALLLSVA